MSERIVLLSRSGSAMNHWTYIWYNAHDWVCANGDMGRRGVDEVTWLMMAFGRCILASVTDADERGEDPNAPPY